MMMMIMMMITIYNLKKKFIEKKNLKVFFHKLKIPNPLIIINLNRKASTLLMI